MVDKQILPVLPNGGAIYGISRYEASNVTVESQASAEVRKLLLTVITGIGMQRMVLCTIR